MCTGMSSLYLTRAATCFAIFIFILQVYTWSDYYNWCALNQITESLSCIFPCPFDSKRLILVSSDQTKVQTLSPMSFGESRLFPLHHGLYSSFFECSTNCSCWNGSPFIFCRNLKAWVTWPIHRSTSCSSHFMCRLVFVK